MEPNTPHSSQEDGAPALSFNSCVQEPTPWKDAPWPRKGILLNCSHAGGPQGARNLVHTRRLAHPSLCPAVMAGTLHEEVQVHTGQAGQFETGRQPPLVTEGPRETSGRATVFRGHLA